MRDPRDRPNIILVNCDDMGYGDLGCYGSTVNDTPVLDRMAAEGVRLTDFHMASSVCSSSRGAMLTGCYPRRIGFATFDHGHWVLFPGYATGLSDKEITVSSVLRQQGYATKLVGKWHCGDQPEFLPTRHGFDSYYGLPYSNDMGRQAGRPPDIFPPLPLMRDEEIVQIQPDQAALTERYMEECVRFIRDNRERPFFLYFAQMYVHLPIYPPAKFLAESRNGRYGGGVACVDWTMHVLLDELARSGLDNNTLVVFTSDNGARGDHGGSNAPLRGGKGSSWEGGGRVPCIARWPGQLPAGTTCNELVTSMDFLPTFARLAGTTEPTDRIIDGKNVFATLRGESRSPHPVFYHYLQNNLEAVRSGKWKLHVCYKNEPVKELYNLEEDLAETTNVYDAHPDIVKKLEVFAEEIRQDIGDSKTGYPGRNCRPVGQVANPKPLTEYDENHPYIIAMYDLADAG